MDEILRFAQSLALREAATRLSGMKSGCGLRSGNLLLQLEMISE
jgi:hypothetical protein